MIIAHDLSKRYGSVTAVDSLSFTVRPGVVTGFLGPNGAGKSTTMRMILGLDDPSAGAVTIDGRHLSDLHWPLREVGALLEARALHPGRSAYNHLAALAASNAIPRSRIDEVLGLVGLSDVGRRRAGKFSLGMGQRLGIATALLGDPAVLLLDEPINGLDPEGILWVRQLLSSLAAEGRTVFVSSHLMSEMALVATDLVVIGRGRLLAATSMAEFISSRTTLALHLRADDLGHLSRLLVTTGASVVPDDDALIVTGISSEEVGRLARDASIALFELTEIRPSLEDVFMSLTDSAVEFHGHVPATGLEDSL